MRDVSNGYHSAYCQCGDCHPYVPADSEKPSGALPLIVLAAIMLWTLICGTIIHFAI